MADMRRLVSVAGRLALLGLITTLVCATASADTEEDYQKGLKSFQVGDIVGAMAPLRTAALAGDARAQALMAEILDRSEFDEEALSLFQKSADQGNADGMFGLGTMLISGEGAKKKDPVKGREWIQKAADLGHKQAINVIAQAYLNAELGLLESDKNSPTALEWVKKAADNDYLPALDALIDAYNEGNRWGLEANKAKANEYLTKANKIRNVHAVKKKKMPRRSGVGEPQEDKE